MGSSSPTTRRSSPARQLLEQREHERRVHSTTHADDRAIQALRGEEAPQPPQLCLCYLDDVETSGFAEQPQNLCDGMRHRFWLLPQISKFSPRRTNWA